MAEYTFTEWKIFFDLVEREVWFTADSVSDAHGMRVGDFRVCVRIPTMYTQDTWGLDLIKRRGRIIKAGLNIPTALCTEEDEKKKFATGVIATMPNGFENLTTLHTLIATAISSDHTGYDEPYTNRIFPLLRRKEFLSVITLYLTDMSAHIVPSSIGSMAHLNTLNLSGNRLYSLPDSFSNLTRLHTLRLANNLFSAIPASIPKDLGKLSMDWNRISSFPAFLFNLSSLEELDLRGNHLAGAVPRAIGNMRSLHSLQLSDNTRLQSLPHTIGNLHLLTHLSITNTQITSLPGSIQLCPGLNRGHAVYISPLYWHVRYHKRFPHGVKCMIRAFCVCNFRFLFPYLPREMLWAIFEYLLYEKE